MCWHSPQRLHNGDVVPEFRRALALITLQDEIREDTAETLAAFASQNVRLKVISGDNTETVRRIAERFRYDD